MSGVVIGRLPRLYTVLQGSRRLKITRIWLVRHGETEWNATKRAQGQADVPLNDLGRLQAQEAAAQLDGVNLAGVYSSDLSRAVDTAEPIAESQGLEVVTDPAFREIDQGEWEGLLLDEIRSRWPELWGPARHYVQRPGGESPEQVQKRALEGVARVVERHPREVVAIVSHGGTIRWIAAHALGYDMEGSARIRGLSNGGAVVLDATLEAGERGVGSARPQGRRGVGSARPQGRLVLGNLVRIDGKTADLEDPNA